MASGFGWRGCELLALLLAGCSALGLDDIALTCTDAPLEGGAPGPDADPCRALNQAHGLDVSRDCRVYQCRADGRGCELRETDRDGDGVASGALCGDDGYDLDCDDLDSSVFSGAEERLDGRDNDCDGDIDEGLSPVLRGVYSLDLPATPNRAAASALVGGDSVLVLAPVTLPGGARAVTGGVLGPGGFERDEAQVVLGPDRGACRLPDNPESCAAGVGDSPSCAVRELSVCSQGTGLWVASLDGVGCGGGGRALFGLLDGVRDGEGLAEWDLEGGLSGVGECPVDCVGARGLRLTHDVSGTGEPRGVAAYWAGAADAAGTPALHLVALEERGQGLVARHVNDAGESCEPAADVPVEAHAELALDDDACADFVVAYPAEEAGCCEGIVLRCLTVQAPGGPSLRTCGCVEGPRGVQQLSLAISGDRLALGWSEPGRVGVARVRLQQDGDQCGTETLDTHELVTGARNVVGPRALALPSPVAAPRIALLWQQRCDEGACLHGAVLDPTSTRLLVSPSRWAIMGREAELQQVLLLSRDGQSHAAAMWIDDVSAGAALLDFSDR